MTLRETMARHGAGALTRTDHHGEAVVVLTSDGSVETTVNAVVDRLDEEPIDGTSRVQRLVALVFLPTESLPGYPVPGDQVRLAMRLGDAATDARITRTVSQDEGGVLVEVST